MCGYKWSHFSRKGSNGGSFTRVRVLKTTLDVRSVVFVRRRYDECRYERFGIVTWRVSERWSRFLGIERDVAAATVVAREHRPGAAKHRLHFMTGSETNAGGRAGRAISISRDAIVVLVGDTARWAKFFLPTFDTSFRSALRPNFRIKLQHVNFQKSTVYSVVHTLARAYFLVRFSYDKQLNAHKQLWKFWNFLFFSDYIAN